MEQAPSVQRRQAPHPCEETIYVVRRVPAGTCPIRTTSSVQLDFTFRLQIWLPRQTHAEIYSNP